MSTPLKPLKWYRDLAGKKGRLEAGAFLVEGEKAIRQVIARHPESIIEILTVTEPQPEFQRYPVRQIIESQSRYISATRTPQGIAAVVRLPVDIYTDRLPADIGAKVVLLEDIQDPGNAGTLIRTAAAFDFSGAILTENGADPFSPKCVQSTAGSVLSVWLRRTAGYLEMAQALKRKGFSLVAAALDGTAGPEVLSGKEKLLLALGNEAAGLSPALQGMADDVVRIPVTREKAESLNVAICGGILMYLST